MHIGDIRHAALPRQPDQRPVVLPERNRVNTAAAVYLRGGDDFMRDSARLIEGRVGVVASGMGRRRLAVQRFDQRQNERRWRHVQMSTAHRGQDHVRSMGRLGKPIGHVGER